MGLVGEGWRPEVLTPRERAARRTTLIPLANYPFFRVTPTKIQAWREVDELKDRVLMNNGTWLV